MKSAIVAVTNDLTTDQRVHRTCMALVELGYPVTLVGRRLRHSLTLAPRSYATERMRLIFDKGPLFYAEYNLRLFFFLLLRKCALIVTNDTDTLAAGFLASKIRRIPLLHDCHEYFRGVPELVGRPRVASFWKVIEDITFPRLKHVIAVNDSVAGLYGQEYGTTIRTVRNVPFRKTLPEASQRSSLGIPPDKKVILYQGAVNMGRGLEESIRAMKHIKADAVLVIAGTGDVISELQELVAREQLDGRVLFTGQIPFEELHRYTSLADIGLSVEKEIGVNYQNCLPNKFLDYIQARIPVLVTPFPEMRRIVEHYGIGEFVDSHDPVKLADRFDAMLANEPRLKEYRSNSEKAAEDLCWEKEVNVLNEMVKNIR